jgi:hypothetical protein
MKDEIRPHDGTSQPPPTLEYAKADASSNPRLIWWPSAVSIILLLVCVPTFGHADQFSSLYADAFIVTVPAFGLACYGWIGNKHKNLLWRTLLILVVIHAFLPLFKNITDVLRRWLWM